jgi:hypothetical protein
MASRFDLVDSFLFMLILWFFGRFRSSSFSRINLISCLLQPRYGLSKNSHHLLAVIRSLECTVELPMVQKEFRKREQFIVREDSFPYTILSNAVRSYGIVEEREVVIHSLEYSEGRLSSCGEEMVQQRIRLKVVLSLFTTFCNSFDPLFVGELVCVKV